jgi:hypothetical protein
MVLRLSVKERLSSMVRFSTSLAFIAADLLSFIMGCNKNMVDWVWLFADDLVFFFKTLFRAGGKRGV